MSKTDNNDKNHVDKKQTKGRILRVGDIIPGTPKRNSEKNEQTTNIPKFDLAEEILAEQRKSTATRRKAPSQQRKVEPTYYTTKWSKPVLSEQRQIIAEIVERDIKTLRDGDMIY